MIDQALNPVELKMFYAFSALNYKPNVRQK